MSASFDVLVIGGGVIGSAVARELSRYRLSLAVVEQNLDVCNETSGRNTGVCHGGFAYDTGSWKAKLCVQGNQMMGDLSEELGFDFRRSGKVLVGNTPAERASLEKTREQGIRNGVQGLEMIDSERLHRMIPGVIGQFALYSPQSGIIDPFGYTIALAENAAWNGVLYFFAHPATEAHFHNGIWTVIAGGEEFRSRWVVNASGIGYRAVSDMLGFPPYHVVYSKDDYIILDDRLGKDVPMPIYTVPSNTYMGIHVTPTTDGNLLLGPTAENTGDNRYYGVEKKNIDALVQNAMAIWPHFTKADFIRTYSGILAKWADENGVIQDFRMEVKNHAVNLVGMESPGLTASVPIARHVIALMEEEEKFPENPSFCPERPKPLQFREMSDQEREEAIRKDPRWGKLVCRCRKVSQAEILQAIDNPLGVHTMTGIKYRTHTMMGRCQGGYCQMAIEQMVEQETGEKPQDVRYCREGSWMFTGKVREAGR
ncbi:MAG: NAD(P)/FAD-dependent oxidoreductase [Sphaerochaeta sp.]|jgi:glycerol-3-phosphate dehydrogenase|nr:NAD(P)/FAD-dependent oxidoreductase [Sphaerochaeta sp.]MCH3921175.1 NAD(P)/FAD-dependent oxidoreductase [Sphaerochaeta sp.]MCI2097662.1 NAD(P)/FAD-dependent oxidoreductase [Sphaerochaeta sp.]MCI2104762.1 NAD(P)/FAD-dependent oxidoreductase [Sphaerochaeta sp.]MCI2129186.1 NAD(P)/FAD-dependent oxidoreductase [Sphaerochaeta sp.]